MPADAAALAERWSIGDGTKPPVPITRFRWSEKMVEPSGDAIVIEQIAECNGVWTYVLGRCAALEFFE